VLCEWEQGMLDGRKWRSRVPAFPTVYGWSAAVLQT
jgi:hypothetical protein